MNAETGEAAKQEPQQALVIKRVIMEVTNDGLCKMEAYVSDNGRDFIGMPLREQRNMFREALDNVEDKIRATFVAMYVDQMLAQKIKPNGFRMSSVKDFLMGK